MRRVIVYPQQHGIMWDDIPMECPAIGDGIVCKLHVYRTASQDEINRYTSYEESLVACQMEAMRMATPDQCAILCRHMLGVYNTQRAFTPATGE